MGKTASRFAGAMMSAAALAVFAAVPSGISIYICAVMYQMGSAASGTMVLLALILGFIGVGLAIGCLYTLWWAFTKADKGEGAESEDDSWRDMPYPKG